MFVALVILAPAVLLLLVRGLRARPSWLPLVLPAAVVGFVGARHWVSFAFVAARLLFVLPFYLLLLVEGSRGLERARVAIFAALACVYLGGIGAYVEQAGFLNKAYVIPSAAISRAIRSGSVNGPPIVILDHHSTSLRAVERDLPVGTRIVLLADRHSLEEALRLSMQDDVGLVWFARNAHDGSAERWSDQVEAALGRRFSVRRTGFVPYSALDGWLMDLGGWTVQPANVIELLEMRRAVPTR